MSKEKADIRNINMDTQLKLSQTVRNWLLIAFGFSAVVFTAFGWTLAEQLSKAAGH